MKSNQLRPGISLELVTRESFSAAPVIFTLDEMRSQNSFVPSTDEPQSLDK
jgi:hypothetical protein